MDSLLDTSTFSCKKVKKRHYYALSGLFLSTIFCEKQIKRIRKHRIELQLSLTRQTSLFVLDWCCRGLPGNRRVKR